MGGITKMVHRIDDADGPYKTVGEVAEYFERTRDTVRRWGRITGVPTHKMVLGDHPNAFVWLYTEEDIQVLEEYSKDINPKGGRPRKDMEDSA